jgi:hypothetical protein
MRSAASRIILACGLFFTGAPIALGVPLYFGSLEFAGTITMGSAAAGVDPGMSFTIVLEIAGPDIDSSPDRGEYRVSRATYSIPRANVSGDVLTSTSSLNHFRELFVSPGPSGGISSHIDGFGLLFRSKFSHVDVSLGGLVELIDDAPPLSGTTWAGLVGGLATFGNLVDPAYGIALGAITSLTSTVRAVEPPPPSPQGLSEPSVPPLLLTMALTSLLFGWLRGRLARANRT